MYKFLNKKGRKRGATGSGREFCHFCHAVPYTVNLESRKQGKNVTEVYIKVTKVKTGLITIYRKSVTKVTELFHEFHG